MDPSIAMLTAVATLIGCVVGFTSMPRRLSAILPFVVFSGGVFWMQMQRPSDTVPWEYLAFGGGAVCALAGLLFCLAIRWMRKPKN